MNFSNESIFTRGYSGFTLAETLIVLGIIGIIAALTIPSLVNNVEMQSQKTSWKKQYSVLSNAYNSVLNDNGGNIKGLCTDNLNGACILSLLSEKLNVQKICTLATTSGNCWNTTVKNMGGGSGNIATNKTGMILNDGSFVMVHWIDGTNCDNDAAYKKSCGRLYVDINGFKKPNVQGLDIFRIYVDENKLFPTGTQDDYTYDNLTLHGCNPKDSSQSESGLGCSAIYLQE